MSLKPTTKAQVSGHKFLVRRLEHGLVFGDIRMIHDPLQRRLRAVMFAIAMSVLIAVGAGAMAIFAPAPNPGDAHIIQAQSGQLYVRVDNNFHPVGNLTSARLIVGKASEPAKVGDELLAQLPKAIPVGISDAPALFSTQEPDPMQWLVCHMALKPENRLQPQRNEIIILADQQKKFVPLAKNQMIFAGEEILTSKGRAPITQELLHLIRRDIAITAHTPIWRAPKEVRVVAKEHPAITLPDPVPTIYSFEGRSFALLGDKAEEIGAIQARILSTAGARREIITATELGQKDFLDEQVLAALKFFPPADIQWLDPSAHTICINHDGEVGTIDYDTGAVALSGQAVATHFAGSGTAVAVDTGSGIHIIGETGLRHRLESPEVLDHLGIEYVQPITWAVLRLLPEGTPLGRQAALTPIY
ncbi:Type VII secretion system protein eccB1 [Corynebacterium kutscheri]|uniref:Type VII secretion protein EccB, Actinobacterial n=1 Tax=Corynebacterium kutscheri TaxID=35755 RepID=A0A0F6QZA4_9CORY|nr:type VII secretion protein EccB [Corynebacterium kutscheri]AKE40605.1 type VII secretion protein EccB, Actinobacterial [Corynebacterium kutscheri]VEH11002.1 Type VII secretion system protein eccB1 [Corynebacterium kutscheri]VEH80518.1 Type VII secretion system protein eccB1 [Corynebacterium kutscheri]